MNQGKRSVRNFLLAMLAVSAVLPGLSRLHAAVVDPDTPPWLRSLASLGLRVNVTGKAAPQSLAVSMEEAGQLRFTQINVDGDFTVEVVAGPVHKVSLIGTTGQGDDLEVKGRKDGLLLIKGGAGSKGALLRIEAPSLKSIEARQLHLLTIRGWQAPEFTLLMRNLAGVRLEECAVEQWILWSDNPVVVQADEATFSAGYDIQASGQITIHGAGGQNLTFRGVGSRVSLRTRE